MVVVVIFFFSLHNIAGFIQVTLGVLVKLDIIPLSPKTDCNEVLGLIGKYLGVVVQDDIFSQKCPTKTKSNELSHGQTLQ